jgi:poly(3-hydroxybutyrate) depolymerase
MRRHWLPVLALSVGCPAFASVALAQGAIASPEAVRTDVASQLAAALDRLAYRPDANGVAGVEKQLSEAVVSADFKAQAGELRKRANVAMVAGRQGDSLRLLYQAIAALRGGDWAAEAFPASLTLDLATPVADKGDPLFIALRGQWSEVPTSPELSLHARVVEDKLGGAAVADLGTQPVYGTDYIAAPQRMVLSIGSITPGHYRLEVDVSAGGKRLTRLASPLDIAEGFHTGAADMKRRLAQIAGHDEAKAVIRYPFSLYRAVNARQREVMRYDYQAGIARSAALLNELEAGVDPVQRSVGDSSRMHEFAGAIVPFRVYVPTSWDGKAQLPLVVFLHGAGSDENNGMDRANGVLPKLAEQHGFIALTPLGYRIESSYGAVLPREGGDFGRIADNDPIRAANSEGEVMALIDEITCEYGVDTKRIYLFGNSMGGMGTWHLAAKYPQKWAAVSPAAGGVNSDNFPYANLKGMPLRAITGDLDMARPGVVATVGSARKAGLKPEFVQVPGGTHASSVEIAMPDTIAFFLKHKRK